MQYEYIPCKVVTIGELDARKRLILNNYQNDPLTPAEKLDAVEELKEIYRLKKESGEKISGRIQTIIAEELGLKKSQVGNYEKVINNAIPEVRELINEGEMTISAGAELSSLDDEEQLMFVENADNFDIKTIKEFKSETEDEFDAEVYYEGTDIDSDFDSNKNISEGVESEATVQNCMQEIDKFLSILDSKITGVEWKVEQPYLSDVIETFRELQIILGI